jgi:small-conductance mechanosensitive channel
MLKNFFISLHAHGHDWAVAVIAISAAILISSFAYFLVLKLVARLRKRNVKQHKFFAILHRLQHPARWIVILSVVFMVIPAVDIPEPYHLGLLKTLGVLWFLSLGWLMVAGVFVAEDLMLSRYDTAQPDNLRARRIRTQMLLLRRLAIAFIVVIDIGLVLSVFRDSRVWQYGAGLLASAGLASLVLATAAKSTASNVLAGIQIAISEPIRIDDVVIVEGEWGRIEEITTSYVVVAIWDKRRLIVPLTYFIEKPFQNWTRTGSDLLGTSFLYTDYSVPVEELRQQLQRVVEASPLWDKLVCNLQVTSLSEKTVELRCLVSSANAGNLFDLRCIVREQMIAYIRDNYPDALPKSRQLNEHLNRNPLAGTPAEALLQKDV